MAVIPGQAVTAYPLPDEELSPTSKNAVSNEAVCEGLNEIKNTLNHKADVIYDTASGDIASFPDGADGLPVKDLTVSIEPAQDLHGQDAPYSDGGGKQLWNKSNFLVVGSSYIDITDGEIKYAGARAVTYIPCNASTTYTVQKIRQVSNDRFTVAWAEETPALGTSVYGAVSADNAGTVGTKTSLTITTGATAQYLAVWLSWNTTNAEVYTAEKDTFMIEEGSMASNYAPYSNICPISGWTECNISHSGADTSDPTVIPISWQSSAGTVYGGTLDVTSGVLTVDRATATITGSTSGYVREGIYIATALFSGAKGYANNVFPDGALCNVAPAKKFGDIYSGASGFTTLADGTGALAITGIATREAFNTYASNNTIQVVYPLATPQTYQLTQAEVTTLLGQNNIWADTGDSTVEYPADTKLYIQKINAPSDDDMVADAQIASGKYFIVNNNLYLSTAAIIAGDPIKPGTNCTLTNLAAALNAINS